MKFIPILFSTPMVEAIIEGRKTQTRRTKGLELVNDNPDYYEWLNEYNQLDIPRPARKYDDRLYYAFTGKRNNTVTTVTHCPYGKVGDVLWVREKFFGYNEEDENKYVYFADTRDSRPWDLSDEYCINEWGSMNKELWPKWKPSIHMPKEACRIFLKITNVRVERLLDISEQEAIAEGVKRLEGTALWYNYIQDRYTCGSAYESFLTLWQSINGKESLEANPWVWVIEFINVKDITL